jgi:hypothetical protein
MKEDPIVNAGTSDEYARQDVDEARGKYGCNIMGVR